MPASLPRNETCFPCVGLVVSGGHTSLFDCQSAAKFELLGGTIDDAAGEAFDKVASMLSLPYPGGPQISKAALSGNANAYDFPRSFIKDKDRLQFSFSGLKTAVRYAIAGPGKQDFQTIQLRDDEQVADLAASFQEAVVDCLVAKSFLALESTRHERLCVGGGVAANGRLRERLQEESTRRGVELHIAPIQLCTDNAVMGAIAVEKFNAGEFDSLDLPALPGLMR